MPSASQLPAPSPFSPLDLPFQRRLVAAPYAGLPQEGNTFPGALQVAQEELKTLEEVVKGVEGLAEQGRIEELLKQHGGALLIRGTHAQEPADFSQLVQALKLGTPHAEVRLLSLFPPSPLTADPSTYSSVTPSSATS